MCFTIIHFVKLYPKDIFSNFVKLIPNCYIKNIFFSLFDNSDVRFYGNWQFLLSASLQCIHSAMAAATCSKGIEKSVFFLEGDHLIISMNNS